MSKDLIIVHASCFCPYEGYKKVDFYLKNRTLEKYNETDVVFFTRSREYFTEIEKGSLKAELSFLWGDTDCCSDFPTLFLLVSAIHIFNKYNLDDINNIAVINGPFFLLKDLEDFHFNLSNDIKYDNKIIYGGKMPIICLSSILRDYFMNGKKIDIIAVKNICSSLNIRLKKIDTDYLHV